MKTIQALLNDSTLYQISSLTGAKHIAQFEYLTGLFEDPSFKKLLKIYDLVEYSQTDSPTACYNNLVLEQKEMNHQAAETYLPDDNYPDDEVIAQTIINLGDDMDPEPIFTNHLGTLYITIIGLK